MIKVMKDQLPILEDDGRISIDTQKYMDRTGFMSCVKDGVPMSRMYGSGIAWWCCQCGMVVWYHIPWLESDKYDSYNVIKPEASKTKEEDRGK